MGPTYFLKVSSLRVTFAPAIFLVRIKKIKNFQNTGISMDIEQFGNKK